MPLGIVADSAEVFVELHRGCVPFEDLKVDSLETALLCEPCNDSDHRFAETVPTKIFGDKNVLEIKTALAAEAREVRIEKRIGHRFALMKSDEALDERLFSK